MSKLYYVICNDATQYLSSSNSGTKFLQKNYFCLGLNNYASVYDHRFSNTFYFYSLSCPSFVVSRPLCKYSMFDTSIISVTDVKLTNFIHDFLWTDDVH